MGAAPRHCRVTPAADASPVGTEVPGRLYGAGEPPAAPSTPLGTGSALVSAAPLLGEAVPSPQACGRLDVVVVLCSVLAVLTHAATPPRTSPAAS